MNNSTVNFTTLETSTNSTTYYTSVIDSLNICLFGISFLFGFPAHSYVLWLIVTGAERSVTSAFFNFNLSICEICNSLAFLFSLIKHIWFSHLITFFAFSQFLIGFGVTGRPLFQCLICVERYLAVVHPVTFLKFKPLRYRVICCAAAWIIVFGFCLCGMYCLLEKDRYLYTWFLSIQFLVFLSVQLFCLVAVLRALKQSGPGERKKEENQTKRRAFHLILITTASMAVIYGPYTIIGFVTIKFKQLRDLLWVVGLTFYVFAGFSQPVLHLHSVGKLSLLCFYNILSQKCNNC